jgi:hypothetical protein
MARATSGTGAAGAYLVAAELALRGWPVAVTLGNTPRTDVLAQVGDAQLPAAIQVKTKGERSKDFRLGGIKDPSTEGANEWVVLVSLDAPEHAYYIVPRNHVWATVQATMPANHLALIGPQEFPAYENQWELLQRPASDVEWMVEDWVRDSWHALPWPDGEAPRRR